MMSSCDETLSNQPLLSPAELTVHDEVTKTSFDSLRERQWQRPLLISAGCLAMICLGTTFLVILLLHRSHPDHLAIVNASNYTAVCQNPEWRREWRSLSSTEKQNYITAIQCLLTIPSIVGLNQTLYDDFPWIHNHVGKSAHESAPFLAWHRYFIHVYEKTLQERCGYKGHLAYWNWELDWQNLSASPVWNPQTGFGGDGDPTGQTTVGKGRCVRDGPFAGLQALYYGDKAERHCLSRGFQHGHKMASYFGSRVRPAAIEKLLAARDYESFNLDMEHGAHLAAPHGVLGDFLVDTAPYDPVFFLHHTQLDRLWWLWQQTDPAKRLVEYTGRSSAFSQSDASLDDRLEMGTLAPSIPVSGVMSTESLLLCYRY